MGRTVRYHLFMYQLCDYILIMPTNKIFDDSGKNRNIFTLKLYVRVENVFNSMIKFEGGGPNPICNHFSWGMQ